MPAAIDPIWKERVWAQTANNPRLGPDPLRRLLVSEHGEGAPSARWIASKQAEYREETEEVRWLYLVTRWPESFHNGSLPWEASATVIELMRHLHGRRPLVRLSRWFWRVTQAFLPEEQTSDTFHERNMIAADLARWEAGTRTDEIERVIELYLRLTPWRSQEHYAWYKQNIPGEIQYQPGVGPNLRGWPSQQIMEDLELTSGVFSREEWIRGVRVFPVPGEEVGLKSVPVKVMKKGQSHGTEG